MNIIITGGLGFIGHNVTRILEQLGHTCYIVDNLTNYGFIPQKELTYLAKNRKKRINSQVFPYDIRRVDRMHSLFDSVRGVDLVIHLASFPRQKVVNQNPVEGADVMSTGLVNLLEMSKTYGAKKFVYISSSMVYGDFESNNQSEYATTKPQGIYGILKLTGEALVADYERKGYFASTIIRPSAVYGEWDVEDRVVSKFMTGAMRGETLKVRGAGEVLDFTYVEDTAMGIVLAALSENANYNTYNITRSEEKQYTLLDAANLAIQIAGKGDVEVLDKDQDFPARGQLSIVRAQKDFGYNPTTNVEQGFQKYYDWYNKNPILWHR